MAAKVGRQSGLVFPYPFVGQRVDTLSQMTTSPWALVPPQQGLGLGTAAVRPSIANSLWCRSGASPAGWPCHLPRIEGVASIAAGMPERHRDDDADCIASCIPGQSSSPAATATHLQSSNGQLG